MRICFTGTTNKNYVMVNTLILKNNKDESKPDIVIDRDLTEYTIEDGIIKMEWRGCYEWDGENPNYNIDYLDLDDYEADIELEDDAPEDYEPVDHLRKMMEENQLFGEFNERKGDYTI